MKRSAVAVVGCVCLGLKGPNLTVLWNRGSERYEGIKVGI